MGLRLNNTEGGDDIIKRAQNAEGEGWVFQGWEVLRVQKGVNSVLDMLSLRYREDQQRKTYQVDSWKYKIGAKQRILEMKKRELGGIFFGMTSKATEVDEIHPNGG